jgi:endo-1,4-beta-xylanase
VVPRYNDVVNVWDVVNEVIDPAEDDCLRRSEWYRLAGTDYISVAFQIAHEMAPTATLILNDYGETSPAKRQCMYDVVKNLQDQGVPIDGIGMQMHINIQNPTVPAIEETIEMFAELGEVHITELDMSIYPNDTDKYTTVPPEVLIKQGYRYKAIFEALRRQGAEGTGNLQSVTFWGLADDATWLTWFPIERINCRCSSTRSCRPSGPTGASLTPASCRCSSRNNSFPKPPLLDGATEATWDMLPWIEIPAAGRFRPRPNPVGRRLSLRDCDVHDATESTEDKVEVFVMKTTPRPLL